MGARVRIRLPDLEIEASADRSAKREKKNDPLTLEQIAHAIQWNAAQLAVRDGLSEPEALVSAKATVRAYMLCDRRLADHQWQTSRCFVCGVVDDPWRPLAPFLTPIHGRHVWMHLEPCHDAYLRQRRQRVDELIDRALEDQREEAA